MSVVAGRNGVNCRGQHSPQDELNRHVDAFGRLADWALENQIDAPVCTLVLRSAKSAPARALGLVQEALAAAGVTVKVILTKVDPEQDLHSLFATLSALMPGDDLDAHIRWARNPRLMDAHEQAVYGPELCWTGDAIRRDADKRNRLVLFEDAPEAILRGAHGFKALWAVSEPVPGRLLNVHAAGDVLSAAALKKDAPQTALDRHVEGWPLLRH
jgi:hypothetical protein